MPGGLSAGGSSARAPIQPTSAAGSGVVNSAGRPVAIPRPAIEPTSGGAPLSRGNFVPRQIRADYEQITNLVNTIRPENRPRTIQQQRDLAGGNRAVEFVPRSQAVRNRPTTPRPNRTNPRTTREQPNSPTQTEPPVTPPRSVGGIVREFVREIRTPLRPTTSGTGAIVDQTQFAGPNPQYNPFADSVITQLANPGRPNPFSAAPIRPDAPGSSPLARPNQPVRPPATPRPADPPRQSPPNPRANPRPNPRANPRPQPRDPGNPTGDRRNFPDSPTRPQPNPRNQSAPQADPPPITWQSPPPPEISTSELEIPGTTENLEIPLTEPGIAYRVRVIVRGINSAGESFLSILETETGSGVDVILGEYPPSDFSIGYDRSDVSEGYLIQYKKAVYLKFGETVIFRFPEAIYRVGIRFPLNTTRPADVAKWFQLLQQRATWQIEIERFNQETGERLPDPPPQPDRDAPRSDRPRPRPIPDPALPQPRRPRPRPQPQPDPTEFPDPPPRPERQPDPIPDPVPDPPPYRDDDPTPGPIPDLNIWPGPAPISVIGTRPTNRPQPNPNPRPNPRPQARRAPRPNPDPPTERENNPRPNPRPDANPNQPLPRPDPPTRRRREFPPRDRPRPIPPDPDQINPPTFPDPIPRPEPPIREDRDTVIQPSPVPFPPTDLNVTPDRQPPPTPPQPPTPPPNVPDNPCERNACTTAIRNDIAGVRNQLGQIAQGGLQLADLALLNVINTKLGPQLPGGIGGFLTRFAKSIHLDKIYNGLSLILQIHNAAMLSRNLAESLGFFLDSGLGILGLKDENDEPLNISGAIGGAVSAFVRGIVGDRVFQGVSKAWNQLSAIYGAAMGIIDTLVNTMAGLAEGLEIIGGYTGKIGNSLKKAGVVLENAYQWMDENLRVKTGRFAAIQRVTDGIESAENVVNNLTEVTEIVQETGDQIENIGNEFERIRNLNAQNQSRKSEAESTNKVTSQGGIPNRDDKLPASERRQES